MVDQTLAYLWWCCYLVTLFTASQVVFLRFAEHKIQLRSHHSPRFPGCEIGEGRGQKRRVRVAERRVIEIGEQGKRKDGTWRDGTEKGN